MTFSNTNREVTRQDLILQYYGLVRKIALSMSRRFPSYVDVEDLIQIGVIGLIDAIDRYRSDKFPTFESYARIRIQGAILDDRRSQDWTPRSVRDRATLLRNTSERLAEKYGRTPTEKEVATELRVSLRRLRKMISGAEIRTVVSMESGADDSLRIGDVIPDQKPIVDEILERNEEIKAVQLHIETLTSKEKTIIEMYYYQGHSLSSISRDFGVSEARISQIHSAVKNKIHNRMKGLMAA